MVLKLAAAGISSSLSALQRVFCALAVRKAAPGKPLFVNAHARAVFDRTLVAKVPLPVAPHIAKKPLVWPAVVLRVMVLTNFCVSPLSPS
jgi:hypothetical protein